MKLENITGLQPDRRSNKSDDRLVDNNVYIGIEIELQNMQRYSKYPLDESKFWIRKDDGSLRNNGMEFITGTTINNSLFPIRGKDLVDSLDQWKEWVDRYTVETNTIPETSERTSLHIHIDVRDLEKEQVDRLILLWATFEPTFFYGLLNNGRETNIYCKPFFYNIEAKRRASQILNSGKTNELNHLYSHAAKYEAMNLLSITNYGSVEFRIHHGTYDSEEILSWINLLLMLRKAATDPNISVREMPEMASGNGMIQFVGQVFKQYAGAILPVIDNKLFYFGLRQAQEIIHSLKLKEMNTVFSSQNGGKDAKDKSIIHKWAKANNRSIYGD